MASAAVGGTAQGQQSSEPSIRAMVMSYADCVVAKKPQQIRAYLLAQSAAVIAESDKLPGHQGCASVFGAYQQVTFRNVDYRNALADALVRADFSEAGPDSFADRAPIFQPPFPDRSKLLLELAATNDKRAKSRLNAAHSNGFEEARLSRLGECVARTDPNGARGLLMTAPDTAEEENQRTKLTPTFQDCAVRTPGGKSYNGLYVRGPIAWNFFRLANSAPKAASGASN